MQWLSVTSWKYNVSDCKSNFLSSRQPQVQFPAWEGIFKLHFFLFHICNLSWNAFFFTILFAKYKVLFNSNVLQWNRCLCEYYALDFNYYILTFAILCSHNLKWCTDPMGMVTNSAVKMHYKNGCTSESVTKICRN